MTYNVSIISANFESVEQQQNLMHIIVLLNVTDFTVYEVYSGFVTGVKSLIRDKSYIAFPVGLPR